jgi:transposase
MSLTVPQKRAIKLMVDKSRKVGDVADKLDVADSTVRDWLTKPEFIRALNERIEQVDGVDAKWRREQTKSVLTTLYEDLEFKIGNSEVMRKTPIRTLIRAIQTLQNELRLDTIGEVTSKVGHYDLEKIQERFKNSTTRKLMKEGNVDNLIEFPKKEKAEAK